LTERALRVGIATKFPGGDGGDDELFYMQACGSDIRNR
jgi:hypothetical protein